MEVQLIFCLLFFCGILPEAITVGIEETNTNVNPNRNKAVICFVSIWSVFRPDRGQFSVESIDPTLCTHVIFGHSCLNNTNDGISTFEYWTQLFGNSSQDKISKLKEKNPNLKAIVSVGGWLDGSIKFSEMAANPKRRQRFINYSVRFIIENGMDGLDIVWQYPAKRGGSPRDKEHYKRLLKELRLAMDQHDLILTACVGSDKDTIDYGYEVSKLSEYLDYMLLYAYDFYGRWSPSTGPNSALRGSGFLNVEFAVNYLLKLGANREKLILGVPLFARDYILNNTESFDQNSPKYGQKFIGHGFQGPYTEDDGLLNYNEVCMLLRNSSQNWSTYWDTESVTPIAIFEEKMISYDDIDSISFKIQYAKEIGLGGIFAYSIDGDDFQGDCGERYPILRTINDQLMKYNNVNNAPLHSINNMINNLGNNRHHLSYILSMFLLIIHIL